VKTFLLIVANKFYLLVCSFLLVQKRTKKRQQGMNTAHSLWDISIELLYYCNEGQWSFDELRTPKYK